MTIGRGLTLKTIKEAFDRDKDDGPELVLSLPSSYFYAITANGIKNYRYYQRVASRPNAKWDEIVTFLMEGVSGFYHATEMNDVVGDLSKKLSELIHNSRPEGYIFSPTVTSYVISRFEHCAASMWIYPSTPQRSKAFVLKAESFIIPTANSKTLLCYVRYSTDDFATYEVCKYDINTKEVSAETAARHLFNQINSMARSFEEKETRKEIKEVDHKKES